MEGIMLIKNNKLYLIVVYVASAYKLLSLTSLLPSSVILAISLITWLKLPIIFFNWSLNLTRYLVKNSNKCDLRTGVLSYRASLKSSELVI
jgi:hypothetical protein